MRQKIEQMVAAAGITVNGPEPWDIQIKDDRFYDRIFREKSMGLGESYMDGWWDCEQIDEMINRCLCCRLDDQIGISLRDALHYTAGYLFNLQNATRARQIAEHHYDTGNDLFHSFLDPYHQYSCAFFESTDDLEQAQLNKLELIAAKLEISEEDHLLDIGCGWGGLARYMAENHGCRVTAVNISKEQLGYAREFCAGLPVHFVDCDYRSIEGRFDKIVSVGMFEHVGRKNYRTFMEVARRCLKDDGIFLLHTIGKNASSRGGADPWITKYIFPNGSLPSIAQIAKAAEGRFVIEDWHNLGTHYEKTLLAWNENFQRAWPDLMENYDERFKRMWEYYLLCCAGAFRARAIQIWQVVMTVADTGTGQPNSRPSTRELAAGIS